MRQALIAAVFFGALGVAIGFWAERRIGPPALAAHATAAPVIRWNGGALDAEEVRHRLAEAAKSAGVPALGEPQRRAALDDIVRDELLADEAIRRGISKEPAVVDDLRQLLAKRLIEREFDQNPARQAVDEAELRAYYQQHLAEYQRPEKVHLSVLLVGPKRKDAEAARREVVAKSATDPRAFDERAQDGDLGPLSKAEMEAKLGPELTRAGWLLVRLGEISEPIETPRGYYLAQLHGRQGAIDVDFAQAREQIRSRLWFERRSGAIEQFVAELKKNAGLQVDTGQLDTLSAAPARP
jgi:peptidyl-prolyl cis-trans isomerase C